VFTLVRYSEIGTKGDNRGYFEELLRRNIMAKLNENSIRAEVDIEESRLIVNSESNVITSSQRYSVYLHSPLLFA